jgi:hypothetical protein
MICQEVRALSQVGEAKLLSNKGTLVRREKENVVIKEDSCLVARSE